MGFNFARDRRTAALQFCLTARCAPGNSGHPPQQQILHQRLLRVHAVLGFVPHHGLRAVIDLRVGAWVKIGSLTSGGIHMRQRVPCC